MKRKRSVRLHSGQDAVEERSAAHTLVALLELPGVAPRHRVLVPNGRIVLLTNQPDLVRSPAFRCLQRIEISLFGQTPTILVLETSGFIKNRRQ